MLTRQGLELLAVVRHEGRVLVGAARAAHADSLGKGAPRQ
jgi:hypothetical protein